MAPWKRVILLYESQYTRFSTVRRPASYACSVNDLRILGHEGYINCHVFVFPATRMWLYYIVSSLGPISLLFGLFYFIVMPVMVFRLRGRIKRLEGRVEEQQRQPVPKTKRVASAETAEPVARALPSATAANLTAKVRTKDTPARTQSLEEKVGAHWFQWIGIAALVLALLFFLKWSFESGIIGPTGRTLIGYVLAGCAMIAGDRLRNKYGVWALAFCGGGALGSYIVTWIAFHTYHLFPSPIAFAIYILTTAVTCLLAGYYGAIALAAFGIIGGFITPILTGEGGSTTSLLLYILILDLGIFALGHARQWRVLNTIGLVGTAIYEIFALSDGQFDRSYAFAFIAAFFVIYTLVPFYYNLLKQQKSEAPDVFMLIGNAVLHFALILLWMDKTPGMRENYDAVVSLGFAVIFLLFSSEVYRRNRQDTPLVLGSLSLAIFFTSLAIPLQFGGVWVSLAWSLEGAFLLWMALTLHDKRIQRFAWIMMILAYSWYFFVPEAGVLDPVRGYSRASPIVYLPSGFYLFVGWMVLFLGILATSISRQDRREQQLLPFVFVGLGVLALAFCANLFQAQESMLSGFERFCEAAALIGGGYIALFQARKYWEQLTPEERKMFSALGIAVQIVTLTYLTTEFILAVNEQRILTSFERPAQVLQVGISILWAVYGAMTLVVGLFQNWKSLRLFSLVILLIAMAKLTLIDFFSLGTGYRVIGFTILGVLLVAASFLYQRKKEELKSFFVSP